MGGGISVSGTIPSLEASPGADPLIVDLKRPTRGAIASRRRVLLGVRTLGAIALFSLMPMVSHAAEYAIGPPPAWVVETQPGVPTSAQLSNASDGVAYLLVDDQVRAAASGR